MIEGVRNNKYTDAYLNTGKRTTKVTNDAPSFLLDLEEDGVVWDRQSKEEPEEKKSDDKALKNKKNDVNNRKDTYESTVLEKTSEKEIKKKPAFMEPWSIDAFAGAFKNLFTSIKHVFKGLFDFIWYGEDKKENDTEKAENSEEIRTDFIMPDTDDEPVPEPKPVKKEKKETPVFDLKAAVRDLHPENAARSTDLLTTYNKFGKAVRPSKSDESLILRGDKSYKA